MSVRATERLIGDLVKVSALPKSPNMVVASVEADTKSVITVWFSDTNEYQEGFFPASALDRVENDKPKSSSKQAVKQDKLKRPGKPAGKRK